MKKDKNRQKEAGIGQFFLKKTKKNSKILSSKLLGVNPAKRFGHWSKLYHLMAMK